MYFNIIKNMDYGYAEIINLISTYRMSKERTNEFKKFLKDFFIYYNSVNYHSKFIENLKHKILANIRMDVLNK
jgi:hypothetical protein